MAMGKGKVKGGGMTTKDKKGNKSKSEKDERPTPYAHKSFSDAEKCIGRVRERE